MAGMSAIFKAAQILGSQKRLADLLGVKAPTVSQWLKGQRPVPVLRCPEIERLTRGEVRCEDLRPDIEWEQHTNMRLDGNNVDIDVEMAEVAKNQLYYSALATTLGGQISKLKSVISSGQGS